MTELSRLPQSRYVLPSFVERTSYGVKEMNPYNKLFEERIIFLGVQIDDASANDVMAQLLTLEAIDPDREITMYINSPGGSMTSMMAIYDTMQFIQPEITTCCIGQAASAAAVLLAAGTKGKRIALPNSRILIHQPATEGGYGQSSDMEIQANEILRMRTAMETILARHTGRDEEIVRRDIERDKFLTAADAKEYGIIDEVLTALKRGPREGPGGSFLAREGFRLFPPGPLRGFDWSIGPHKAVPSDSKRLTAWRDRPAVPGPGKARAGHGGPGKAPCKGETGWHASVTAATC